MCLTILGNPVRCLSVVYSCHLSPTLLFQNPIRLLSLDIVSLCHCVAVTVPPLWYHCLTISLSLQWHSQLSELILHNLGLSLSHYLTVSLDGTKSELHSDFRPACGVDSAMVQYRLMVSTKTSDRHFGSCARTGLWLVGWGRWRTAIGRYTLHLATDRVNVY